MPTRKVKILVPAQDEADAASTEFVNVLSYPNIVVLGDPGAGKTDLMTKASEMEGGIFFHARNFRIYANSSLSGKTVYIDALDEKRSRGDHPDSISEIVEKLVALQPSQVRISCRSLDWLGETDLTLFRPYFEASGGFAVVHLEDLNEDEQRTILLRQQIEDAEGFLTEAEKRGVRALLKNPQTLIMLAEVVKNGDWPHSRSQLFDQATKLLVGEHNEAKAARPRRSYTVAELEHAAGAVCASMLVSDEPCISLSSSSSATGLATYDAVPDCVPEIVEAVLERRVFKAAGNNLVTYSHKTIAEYLGAKWLAQNVKNGYPLGRVLALIAIDGIPALELRGLYAWLPTFLPNQAIQLIVKEPLAVVMYGDPRGLSTSTRIELLRAIEELSQRDPWFRNWDMETEILGSLSGPDMVDSLRSILKSAEDNFQLRHFVLDAIACGPPLVEIADDLMNLLKDKTASYGERLRAFEALVRAAPKYIDIIVDYTRHDLIPDRDELRLAASIVQTLYTEKFDPDDVADLVESYLEGSKRRVVGELLLVGENVQPSDACSVIDSVCKALAGRDKLDGRKKSEIISLISRLMMLAIKSKSPPPPEKLWDWLVAIEPFIKYENYSSTILEKVRVWLSSQPAAVGRLFDLAWSSHGSDKWWVFLNGFQRTILYSCKAYELIPKFMAIVRDGAVPNERRKEAYGAALHLTLQTPQNLKTFEELYEWSTAAEFSAEWHEGTQCSLERWEHEEAVRNIQRQQQRELGREKQRNDFDSVVHLIRAGEHQGWLAWCANVYFANFDDVDTALSPQERLVNELGSSRAEVAIAGMRKVAIDGRVPSLDQILELQARDKYFAWWRAVIAALDIEWGTHGSIAMISDATLVSALAIQLYCPVFDRKDNRITECQHGWREAASKERPELVANTFFKCALADLKAGKVHSDAVYRLSTQEALSTASKSQLFSILMDYPNAPTQTLKYLLNYAFRVSPGGSELGGIIGAALTGSCDLDPAQEEMWVGAAFLECEVSLPEALTSLAQSNRKAGVLWAIKDAIDSYVRGSDARGASALPNWKLAYLIEQFGSNFPIEAHPDVGWTGSKNNWDANDFVRSLINELSSRVDDDAAATLQSLLSVTALNGYSAALRHALANQAALRRQAKFQQPNWAETVEALKNGCPANMADLLEAAIFQIRSIEMQMRHNNIDALKVFWNENQYGQLDKPKPEESARDALVMQFRPPFERIGVRVEPEGHMNQDKRADIVLLPPPGQKLPVELKRDYHDEVWTACSNQLDRLYTRDPEAAGYGLYVVFWYGEKRNGNISKPPASIEVPKSAMQMEKALGSLIPVAHRERLRVIVLDVSQAV